MKIIARQIAPEYQDPRLFYISRSGELQYEDEYWEDISVLPRPGYHNHFSPVVEEVYNKLEKELFTDDELSGKLSSVSDAVRNYSWDYLNQIPTLCAVLTVLTGHPYVWQEIHGSTQRDWQTIVYPSNFYSDDDIKMFEALFFNTGSEYEITYDDEDVGCPFYTIKDKPEEIKKEISNYFGASPEEIELYNFTGYKKIPQYEKM